MGYDIALTRAPWRSRRPSARLGPQPWRPGYSYPRGHPPICPTCRPNKKWRSAAGIGAEIGSAGPAGRILVHGEPGWDIVDRGSAPAGRSHHRQAGKGSFYGRTWIWSCARHGITHIVLTGITTDVCVHTTMRDANDRGYECLILSARAPAPPTPATTRPR